MNDRDQLAAAALTGLLAAPTDKDRSMDYWARLSYEAADAMLRERAAQQTSPSAEMATARLSAANTWLQDEIKRLRLTDEEREAIAVCIDDIRFEDVQARLRSLLERTK